jgi:outer membrane protein OmpA-like peptidoglycan-associated protein
MRFLTVLLMLLLSVACAKTTVVLLPDDEGKVGQVSLTTDKGTTVLDEENEYAVISALSSNETKKMEQEEILETFSLALAANPPKPVSILLYFQRDSDFLTEESEEQLEDVIKAVKDREPSEVSIIGHTDTVGDNSYNMKLSLGRAEAVKKMLEDMGLDITRFEVTSFGENDLLVKTPDETPEPLNRRVEVMVR